MDITLHQLEAFTAVVENHSFSAAAETLFLSQSTVSSHVAQLERVLQTQLFTRRDKKHIELTEQGRRVYNCAKEILNMCGNIEQEFRTETGGRPFITIAASTVPSRYLVPQLIAEYAKDFPGSRFSVLEGDSAFAMERVKSGEAALAFVGTKLKESSFCYHTICKDRIVLISPNNEEFSAKKNLGALGKDLLGYPIIMRKNGSGTRKEADRYLEKIGIKEDELNIVAYMNDLESVKKAVASGLGVSLISERVAENAIREGRVLSFSLDKDEFYRNLYMIYAKNRHLSAKEQSFLNFVRRSDPKTMQK